MNTKPRLVDPNWFPKPQPKIIKPKKIIPPHTNNSFMINIIGISILIIGGLCIYQRYKEKEKIEFETKHKIIELNEYVKRNIK